MSSVVLALVLALGLSACGGGHNAVDRSGDGQFRFVNATARGSVIPLSKREQAAPLIGTLIGGGAYRLADHRGNVVLINFWASWCAPCVTESPMLDSVYKSLKSSGVDFLGVDIKDERQAAEAFIAAKHMSYPMVYDEPAKTALQLGIPTGGLPVTVVVDRSSRIAAVYIGPVQRAEIASALRQLAAETP